MVADTQAQPARGRVAPPGRGRRSVALVVAGLGILQLLWIVTLPPFRGSDEFDHAYRAAAVARGEWRTTENPTDGRGMLVTVPADLVGAAHDQCVALDYTGKDNCNPVGPSSEGLVHVASGAGNYHPAYYWVVGTVARPFDGANALYAMRVAGALLCLLFLGIAAYAVSLVRGRSWGLVAVAVAVSPVFLYSTAVPAPNGLEMSAALALWALLLALGQEATPETSRVLLAMAAVAAVVLSTVRMMGPLFVLLIFLIAAIVAGGESIRRILRSHRLLVPCVVLAVGVAVAGSALWVLTTGSTSAPPEREGGDWGLSSVVLWPLQTIAAFPYRNQTGALIVYPVVGFTVLVLVAAAIRFGTRRERWALGLALGAAFFVPVVITVLTQEGRGVIWQGRYGLPLNVGLVLLSGFVLGRSRASPSGRWLWPWAIVMAAAYAACFLKVRALELTRPPSITDASWVVPSPGVIVVGCLAAWLLFALACRETRE